MNIGIDARFLGYAKAGVRIYLEEIVSYINNNEDGNTYYLYTNREISVPFELKPHIVIKYYKSKIGTLGLRTKLPKILKEDDISIFWGPGHLLPRKVEGIKYVLTVHDLAIIKIRGVGSFYNTIINKLFLKKSVRIADKIISISQSTKQDLVDEFGADSNRIDVIYNSKRLYKYYELNRVHNDEFKEVADKFNINTDYMLFVGTIEPRKNLVNSIKAFNEFKAKTNSDMKFVLAGGNGWKFKKIYEEYNNSPYKADIIFAGYVSTKEKELLYRNAKFSMFVSLYEGFGYPIIESLSCATPVVTSNLSSMPEVGGDVCYYVNDPHNVSEIAKMIEEADLEVSANKIDADKLVAQANKFANNDFLGKTYRAITELK